MIECDETPILGSEHLQNHAAEDDVLYFVDYKSNTTFKIKLLCNKKADVEVNYSKEIRILLL